MTTYSWQTIAWVTCGMAGIAILADAQDTPPSNSLAPPTAKVSHSGGRDWKSRHDALIQEISPAIASVSPGRLAELRRKAAMTEAASIAVANRVREEISRTDGDDKAAIERLRGQLREAVESAFLARHDLHFLEVTSLAMKAQSLSRKLAERERSHSEIIDRRVDDLLNPAKRWTAELPESRAAAAETGRVGPALEEDNKLLIRKSAGSVKVEGTFDATDEILLVIGATTSTKQLEWGVPISETGEYTAEVRRAIVTLNEGAPAAGIQFIVENAARTVHSTSNISFTETDPLPDGKMVFSPRGSKLTLKRKTALVQVVVGHVELEDGTVAPVSITSRRRADAGPAAESAQPEEPETRPVAPPEKLKINE